MGNPSYISEKQYNTYGVGTLNGSLWTISVEIQFYLLTPLVVWLFARSRAVLLVVMGVLIAANTAQLLFPVGSVASKLFTVTTLPWLGMFIVGGLVARTPDLMAKVKQIPFVPVLCVYIALYAVAQEYRLGTGNDINFLLFACLCLLVLKGAFTATGLSHALLKGNDYSYGVYLYHMPIINLFIYLGLAESAYDIAPLFVIMAICAALSWHLVEQPSLLLKRLSLKDLSEDKTQVAPSRSCTSVARVALDQATGRGR